MNIAADQIALLERLAAHHLLPRVRALHLPPATGANGKNGEFCALELEDGALGLSYVMLDDTLARLHREAAGARLAGADPLTLARRLATAPEGAGGTERSLGLAAINALTRHFFALAGFTPPPSRDSIGQMDPQPGERIGMVGYFRPLVKRIAEVGAELIVIELDPALAGQHDGYRVSLDAAELRNCGKVLCTSSVLINGSVGRMLAAAAQAQHFALIGPGAGCLPDPLFANGVSLLGGSWISDPQAFVEALASGGAWGEHAFKFALARADYPGFDALLARC